jgi:hypothetical protein
MWRACERGMTARAWAGRADRLKETEFSDIFGHTGGHPPTIGLNIGSHGQIENQSGSGPTKAAAIFL